GQERTMHARRAVVSRRPPHPVIHPHRWSDVASGQAEATKTLRSIHNVRHTQPTGSERGRSASNPSQQTAAATCVPAKTASTAFQEPVAATNGGAIAGNTIEPTAPDVFITLNTWGVPRPPRSIVKA